MKEYEFSIFDYDWKWDDTKKALRVTERKQTPEEWVNEMLHAFDLDPAAGVGSVGRYTYAYDNTGRTARACCAASDEFDDGAGIAIAYARLRNLPIHPAFVPLAASKPKLIPLRSRDTLKVGARVYDEDTEEWGTITKFAFASQNLVTVRWDNRHFDCLAPRVSPKLATEWKG